MRRTAGMFILLVMLLWACAPSLPLLPAHRAGAETVDAGSGETPAASSLFAWITYWDREGMLSEVAALGGALTGISSFSTLFNEADQLYLPNETVENTALLKEIYGNRYPVYLTVVNDITYENKPSSLKNTDLLGRLFQSEAAMDFHIREIIDLAIDGEYDGIELDYEAIGKNAALWEQYASFIARMYKAALAEGFHLRVILEPSAVDRTVFPEGPEYVMMCYNLYGYHSGPGPKADLPFIDGLAQKCKNLPGRAVLAFATGGFDWTGGKNPESLSESQAAELIKQTGAEAVRDEKSKCLTFAYRDGSNRLHEVWYADGETILSWIQAGQATGETRFALWRLGGNELKTLENFSKIN